MAAHNETKPGRSGQHSVSNLGEPASSLIAAHLAPHLAPGRNGDHGIERETFSQLRREIFDQDENGQVNLDDNLSDIHTLICVVIKAGLEPLLKRRKANVPKGDVLGQVVDCLDIVQMAIQKAPHVLREPCDPGFLGQDTAGAPLFTWIIPFHLAFLCAWDEKAVREKICRVLSITYTCQFKASRSWHSSRSIIWFLRACVIDLIVSIENTGASGGREVAITPLYFPSWSNVFANCLETLNIPRSAVTRRPLGSLFVVAKTCFQVLESFCSPISTPAFHSRAYFFRECILWNLQCYQRLWKSIFIWFELAETQLQEEHAVNLLTDLIFLAKRCFSCSQRLGLGLDERVMRALVQNGADMLSSTKLQRSFDLQHALSQLLSEVMRASHSCPTAHELIAEHFLEDLEELTSDADKFAALHQSFQHVTVRVVQGDYYAPGPSSKFQRRTSSQSVLRARESTVINEPVPPENGLNPSTPDSERARKRPRLMDMGKNNSVLDIPQIVTNAICTIVGSLPVNRLEDMDPSIMDAFPDLSANEKCETLLHLGHLACALSGSITIEERMDVPTSIYRCEICDSSGWKTASAICKQRQRFDELRATLASLIPTLRRSAECRVAGMLALQNILIHDSKSEGSQLGGAPYGEFCLQSLCSSVRELRIAAGKTMAIFLRAPLDEDVRRNNFVIALKYLQQLQEKNELSVQETCIMVLRRIAEVSGDEEMNIVLLRLLEYLGHTSPFISGVAYTELSKLAQHLALTPAALFRPFWRTLSVLVIKHLQTRPHMADLLCDLIGMKVDNFLRLTEVHILPYLVMTRKKDIIARIARTYEDKTVFQLCTSGVNIAAILCLLLTQEFSDLETMVPTILSEVAPGFKDQDLAALVRMEPILIACELLKGIGDSSAGEKSKHYKALELVASVTPLLPGQESSSGIINPLTAFLEGHVLGIITEFANVINDFQIRQSIVEKKRSVIAIGQMVKIAGASISIALPQICACLRSALDMEELREHAFSSWCTMVTLLDDIDVEALIDQSFAIIVKNWTKFRARSRQKAIELVEHILENCQELVANTFTTMPSLASIPEMANLSKKISDLKEGMDIRSQFETFCLRCQNENQVVVEQALEELVPQLRKHEEFIHRAAINEQPNQNIAGRLTRSLLDCCAKFNPTSENIMLLSAKCLGIIGCLDPSRIDLVKEKKDILVLSNFQRADETVDFALFFLQHVLVEAFLSASNTRSQGFLAYAMQSLLKYCGLTSVVPPRTQDLESGEMYRRWLSLPEYVRNTLTPFLSSKYTVIIGAISTSCNYPLFSSNISHPEWLRTFVLDLLQKGNDTNTRMIFNISSRIIRSQDISIAAFLLPFAALNAAISDDDEIRQCIRKELANVLEYTLPEHNHHMQENILLCSESVFGVLDYLSRWVQGKKRELTGSTTSRDRRETMDGRTVQVKRVEALLSSIPAEVISRRAVECKSYARALFHWEQYIRQQRSKTVTDSSELESLYQKLQDIYTQIDEPDGIEGISSHLHVLNIDQQILEHRKAGRWVAAQTWYELQLNKTPEDIDVQMNLLTCLKESGQHDVLLNQFGSLKTTEATLPKMLPFAVEASWVTSKWDRLETYLAQRPKHGVGDFTIGVGSALAAIRARDQSFKNKINELRLNVAKGLTSNSVSSFQASHDSISKLHVLAEMELLTNMESESSPSRETLFDTLDRRLAILGGCISDKQYILGLRRAIMELLPPFNELDVASIWLIISRLARKANSTEQAFNAVLHAAQLKDKSATIEYARLLWKEGHHRKAIRTLESAIAANAFGSFDKSPGEDLTETSTADDQHKQNMLTARAHLLLARWMDSAGQTQSEVIIQKYRQAIKFHTRWEKAHYYLGKHYAKILDSEKAKPIGKEAQIYLSGEAAKLVIDNYLRSLAHGNKYVFQSLPKALTLWLEHASAVNLPFDPKRGDNEEFQKHNMTQRKRSLDDMNAQFRKYINRIPAALLFTILPQVVTRICHSNNTVYNILTQIVVKTVHAFPQQGLWTLLAVLKSSTKDRASRGLACIHKITETAKKQKTDISAADIRVIMNQGQKFSDELLKLCGAPVEDRVMKVSLARHLGFNHRVAPCRLVIPLETTLTPILPASHETNFLKTFRAFANDPITIETVLDEGLVLLSMQRPRKISIRGSDGKVYSLLCKPKDDLRKDQRLMEYNTMINRFLKRDLESNKRRLYIKTYAVTPLNERCGLIEWVDGLRPLREIVTKLLKARGIMINYTEIKHYLTETSSSDSKLAAFSKLLTKYPPVLHEWFVEMFPEPSAWLTARLRYTRSCAVMSMVGSSLGLGDRHGENILFEEGTGEILHVDFNCLFDKGLTLEMPELVPFRLTHNMIDAFGAYGYNGPFRKTCELTQGLLRQNEDSLMTILETFLHDPTTDFIDKKKRTNPRVPDTPEAVLEFVRNRLRGLLPGESVPLSVGGQVDELIIQATSIRNLAAMYIGWCAFF
ncbi:UVSB PI-3 kinase [Coccidioides immitis RS]|uniref:Serine/threonine-protein kinase MEC1 n=4 Tax=Coccidioides immitis TaxID=5501 RepID=A0A0E1RVG2_COCIM|nr:UVSB PI-3 kinase [Coccidioides immitis RS]EAS29766.2 UVSB PI-3 kinase [Coccidioides immitis RS]